MLKKTLISFALLGAVALAVASSGGGDKKKPTAATPGISLMKKSSGFYLRAGRSYTGKLELKSSGTNSLGLGTRAVVTYRKGNTIYILPTPAPHYRQSATRTNLNVLDLRLNLRK